MKLCELYEDMISAFIDGALEEMDPEGLEQSLKRLLQIAREHGAPDNVTAVLLEVV